MTQFTEWQLTAPPKEAAFMVVKVIRLKIHYLMFDGAEHQWDTDKGNALAIKDREHAYALARKQGGLMIMEVQP